MKTIRKSLLLILSLTLFASCGIFGSKDDSEPVLGTYEVVDGLFLDNVYKVNGPPPAPSNSPNLPSFTALLMNMNYGFYNIAEVPVSVYVLNGDLGLGYGVVLNDKILAAATINLPLFYLTTTVVTVENSVERTSDTQSFVTDAA